MNWFNNYRTNITTSAPAATNNFYTNTGSNMVTPSSTCLSSPNYPPNGALMTQGAAV